jgi:hypothetical protein
MLVLPSTERSTLPVAARLLAALALIAPLAAGCVTESAPEQDPATAQLTMPLIQSGSRGELYHLANATFDITGATNGFATTVDGGGSDVEIDLTVPPGVYLIRLHDGWTLEKSIDGGGTFEPVSALLGSANPQNLRVLANQPLTVEFDFLIRSATGTMKLMRGAVGASGPFPPFFSPVATEIYGDQLGLLQPIASGLSGAFLEYTVGATPDGQFILQGSIEGNTAAIFFGPHPIAAVQPTLDADGFPEDVFFYDAELPFLLSRPAGTISGVLRMRHIVPSEP